MRPIVRSTCGLAAVVFVLGFAAEVRAGFPGGLLLQRRGSMRLPPPPSPIDSSPQIDSLNKALKALGSTDRDYDGHREKAVAHIASAIHHLELPNARGRSNAAIDKAATGKAAVATKTATTSQAASDESLRKAKTILFSVYHYLKDHIASAGQKKANADILIAIDEISKGLNPPKTAASTTTATTTTTTTARPTTTTTARPTTTTTSSPFTVKPSR